MSHITGVTIAGPIAWMDPLLSSRDMDGQDFQSISGQFINDCTGTRNLYLGFFSTEKEECWGKIMLSGSCSGRTWQGSSRM